MLFSTGNLHSFRGTFAEITSNLAKSGLAFYLGLWAYDGWYVFVWNFLCESIFTMEIF